jgi:serine/threonine protein kinase
MRLKNFVDVRNNSTSLSLPDTKQAFKSLIDIVKYIHEQNVIIRNLTPANIVLKKGSTTTNPAPKGNENDGLERRNTVLFEVKVADFSQAVNTGSFKVIVILLLVLLC